MTYAKKILKGLLPVLFIICTGLQAAAQTETPLAQAVSSATAQAVSSTAAVVTAGASSAAMQALAARAKARESRKQGTSPSKTAVQQPAALTPTPAAAQEPPAPAMQAAPLNGRRTLFVTIGRQELKLRLEAPKKMCFLDRTSAMQDKIYTLLSGMVEQHRDQVLLGVFMDCANITSPDSWAGMPDAGFISWMNPAVGETTPMSRQDYLDMREASFPQYVKNHAATLNPYKTLHRNQDNVSLGMSGEEEGQDGAKHKSVNVLSTTLLQHVPVEITLHYTDDVYTGKLPPTPAEAYAAMDRLIAQQIALNE